MKCAKCGAEIDIKNKFCPYCGAPVSASKDGTDSSGSPDASFGQSGSSYGQKVSGDFGQGSSPNSSYGQNRSGSWEYEPGKSYGQNNSYGQTNSYGQNSGGYSQRYSPNGSYSQNSGGYNGGYSQSSSYSQSSGSYYPGYNPNGSGIKERNLVLGIIFSIITCGIYGIYWIYEVNNDVNTLANEPGATSGGYVILFSLITCGIYGIYWAYKMGERCDRIKGAGNGSTNILYLVLAIFGLQIVNLALIQDTINNAIR